MGVAGALRAATLAMICVAALWDLVGMITTRPPWWPPVSYVLDGAAVLTGCVAVLVTLFTARHVRGRTGGQLIAIGMLLALWLLRGHPEIPPDVPLVAAEVLAAALYAVFMRPAAKH